MVVVLDLSEFIDLALAVKTVGSVLSACFKLYVGHVGDGGFHMADARQ